MKKLLLVIFSLIFVSNIHAAYECKGQYDGTKLARYGGKCKVINASISKNGKFYYCGDNGYNCDLVPVEGMSRGGSLE